MRGMLAILGCLTLSALLPISASADASSQSANTSVPPVTINSCGPIIEKNGTTNVAGLQLPASTSEGIAIEFVNETTEPVNLVNFNVESAGEQFVIRDVGTFSPGVSIKHKYRNGAGQAFVLPQFISPKVHCTVASVRFADGSLWRRGQVTTAANASATAAPGSVISILSADPAQLTLESGANAELLLVSSRAKLTAFKETDDCANVASVFVAATGDAQATYSVKPIAPGSCTVHVADESGNTIAIPLVVH